MLFFLKHGAGQARNDDDSNFREPKGRLHKILNCL